VGDSVVEAEPGTGGAKNLPKAGAPSKPRHFSLPAFLRTWVVYALLLAALFLGTYFAGSGSGFPDRILLLLLRLTGYSGLLLVALSALTLAFAVRKLVSRPGIHGALAVLLYFALIIAGALLAMRGPLISAVIEVP